LVLSLGAATICIATGISWALAREIGSFGLFLMALSGGYVAANVVGVLVVPNIGYALGEFLPLAFVRVLSWVGIVVGGTLYVGSLVAGILALRARGAAMADEDPAL